MSKDIKKALEHCVEWNCDNCPNREELGSGETVCRGRLLPEVLEYVTDLEAKLAESEKKFIVANNLRKNADEVLLNYKTEKYGLDKTIQELRKMKLSLPEKEWYYKGFENCERQMSSHIADLTLEVKELKQQLTKKEGKIETLKQRIDSIVKIYSNDFVSKDTELKELRHKVKQHNQDKISFAVNILEELVDCSNYINSKLDFESGSYVSEKSIRDKIKYLKGKKDE